MVPDERFSRWSLIVSHDEDGMRVAAGALLVHVAQALAPSEYPLLAEACLHEPVAADAGVALADCLAPITCMRSGDRQTCRISRSDVCAARDPRDAHHTIIDGGFCRRANASAVAAALLALDATVEVTDAAGSRSVPAEQFFALTDPNVGETDVTPWRVLGVTLPVSAAGGFQQLMRAIGSDTVDSPLCLAAVRRNDGDVRFVLGGVATRPYRIYTSIEEEAAAGGLDEDSIAGLAERALLDAEAGPESAAKVEAAAALLRRAIAEIDANSSLG